jgi:Secretion system C-terminal sorting domain
MKTKITFKGLKKELLIYSLLIIPAAAGYSQECFGNKITITVENIINTSTNTLEFDVYVTNSGSTLLSLGAIQGAVIYDNRMINKNATTSFAVITQPNKTGSFSQFNPIVTKHSIATNQLRWIQNPVSLSSGKSVNLPSQKKMKFASFRLTSSLPLQANLVAKLIPQHDVKVDYTNLLATVYCNNNSNSTRLKSTATELNTTNTAESFTAFAIPNPYSESFHLEIQKVAESTIQVSVYDMLGKLIEDKSIEATDIQTVYIGANYPSGIYNVNVSQGENNQTLRIIRR